MKKKKKGKTEKKSRESKTKELLKKESLQRLSNHLGNDQVVLVCEKETRHSFSVTSITNHNHIQIPKFVP